MGEGKWVMDLVLGGNGANLVGFKWLQEFLRVAFMGGSAG
jgi:hypothetical protein